MYDPNIGGELIKATLGQHRVTSSRLETRKFVVVMMGPAAEGADDRWTVLELDSPALVCDLMGEIFSEAVEVFGRETMMAAATTRARKAP